MTDPTVGAPPKAGTGSPERRRTAREILDMKRRGEPIVVVTAYDHPTAQLADQAGIEILLVGDSVGTVVLGYESTLPVTMEDILHHTRAVTRARPSAMVIADMPFMSYQVSDERAVENAGLSFKVLDENVEPLSDHVSISTMHLAKACSSERWS